MICRIQTYCLSQSEITIIIINIIRSKTFIPRSEQYFLIVLIHPLLPLLLPLIYLELFLLPSPLLLPLIYLELFLLPSPPSPLPDIPWTIPTPFPPSPPPDIPGTIPTLFPPFSSVWYTWNYSYSLPPLLLTLIYLELFLLTSPFSPWYTWNYSYSLPLLLLPPDILWTIPTLFPPSPLPEDLNMLENI